MLGALVMGVLSACQVDNPGPGDTLSAPSTATPRRVVDDLAYGSADDQVLDVLRPSSRPSNRRALVWLHGGGWIFGDENGLPPLLNDLVEREGYTVFAVRYRLAAKAIFPAAVNDVDLAMRWIKVHGGEYGVDTRRLVTLGFSSGAHLAMLEGFSNGAFAAPDLPPDLAAVDPTPAAIVALAAPVDLPGFAGYTNGGRDMLLSFLGCTSIEVCNPALLAAADPVAYADPADPKVYLAQGDSDHVVPVLPTDAAVTQLETRLGIDRIWYDRVDTGDVSVRDHDLDYGVNRKVLGLFIAAAEAR